MNKQVKIGLIVIGLIGLGVGGYFVYKAYTRKSGDKTKDDRKIFFNLNNKK